MAQVATYTLVDDESADGTYETLTNQGVVTARTIFVQGTFTGSVLIEASYSRTGDDWVQVLSKSAEGAYDLNTVCHRLRAKLSTMSDGSVTVRAACRIEQN